MPCKMHHDNWLWRNIKITLQLNEILGSSHHMINTLSVCQAPAMHRVRLASPGTSRSH
jgi:hypothetical protein